MLHRQIERRPPQSSQSGGGVAGNEGPSGPPAAPPLELRFQFDQLYLTDLQPVDAGAIRSMGVQQPVLLDSRGRVNGAALLQLKPNCVILQPLLHRTMDSDGISSLDATVRQAWSKRKSFLRHSAIDSVLAASKLAQSTSSGSDKYNSLRGVGLHRSSSAGDTAPGSLHARRHRGSDDVPGAGGPGVSTVRMSFPDDSGSDHDDDGRLSNDDDDDDNDGDRSVLSAARLPFGPGGASDGSVRPGGRKRAVWLNDGPEFRTTGHVPMLVVGITIPVKTLEARASVAEWKSRNSGYVQRQLDAWTAGLPVPFPARDSQPTDTKSGFHITILADSIVFVHSKRFEDEIKAAIDVTTVRCFAMFYELAVPP